MLHWSQAIVAQALPMCATAGSGTSASGSGPGPGGLDLNLIFGFLVAAGLVAALSAGITLFLVLRMRPAPAAIPVWNLAPPAS